MFIYNTCMVAKICCVIAPRATIIFNEGDYNRWFSIHRFRQQQESLSTLLHKPNNSVVLEYVRSCPHNNGATPGWQTSSAVQLTKFVLIVS